MTTTTISFQTETGVNLHCEITYDDKEDNPTDMKYKIQLLSLFCKLCTKELYQEYNALYGVNNEATM